ncbi:ABC transporter ATP-binding protein [Anabaena cylindrica FACHB-243]|uniref:Teichoic-acid-transporting ATPase n=1 Tax=Anabaena cylindrica (strain ATCC 27899 / PCC 7122) TaxID=272123 RepID=K9ZKU4_ANACC|nr:MULTISPECIES: ABC transporter ATP-binding protein [Anabaena]AFZ59172.1 Teichoic-acid-transporting ATPase [Anabaena cylindrica PCC 7122]MBD2416522.1 ABC transporter ATP-binding protein [Anabaena cylindrica FACHB-243]MBY5281094.1 ABC transporter ATP-binding protein [Anabaena sp. CCAP 1446/1C]MBY5309881.1 ABC transporter ATP-binding protein [Anabaena sp. CCAP 1446/1C]MCM2407460.1 ABC transporter ATP-binding protein [Anabaena sp. CCAP 1446/1C]
MPDKIIHVENLSKKYIIGHQKQERYTALRDVISNQFKSIGSLINPKTKTKNPAFEEFWALKDVSFEVNQGDRIGIIGRNGAGKSTLLKILSRITEPTQGRINIKGRVASLLEVGTGFHPELTGRENIYLNGAILGMSKAEIKHKFDEIVAFSEVEKFLDTPVKRYSSGMYVRLAFSVAAHLEPEILIVDEVLAVGDAAFQKKCLGKMENVASEGRTVIFVSHNIGAVRALCNRGIVLSSGNLIKEGDAESCIAEYLAKIASNQVFSGQASWNMDNAPGNEYFRILKMELVSVDGEIKSSFSAQEEIIIRIHYQLLKNIEGMRLVLQILAQTGEIAFTSTDHAQRQSQEGLAGHHISVCHIPGKLLNLSNYVIKIWAGIPGKQYLLEPVELMIFSIIGGGNHHSTYTDYQRWPGVVCPDLKWKIINNGDDKKCL